MHRAAARRVGFRGGQHGHGTGQRTSGKGSRKADSEGCAPGTGRGPRGGAFSLSGAGEATCRQDGRSQVVESAPRARSMRGWNLVDGRSRFLRQSRRTGSTLHRNDQESSAPRIGEGARARIDQVCGVSEHLEQHRSDGRDCAVQRRDVLALDQTRQCLLRSRRGCNLVVA
jgi:hypothetical protein